MGMQEDLRLITGESCFGHEAPVIMMVGTLPLLHVTGKFVMPFVALVRMDMSLFEDEKLAYYRAWDREYDEKVKPY